jgi:hypothetical protein
LNTRETQNDDAEYLEDHASATSRPTSSAAIKAIACEVDRGRTRYLKHSVQEDATIVPEPDEMPGREAA